MQRNLAVPAVTVLRVRRCEALQAERRIEAKRRLDAAREIRGQACIRRGLELQ